jgi:hypothetical protein
MIQGILFHKIVKTELDVARILHMTVYKRLFMILQRDLPYELLVKYYDPQEIIHITPVMGSNGGVILHNTVKLYQDLAFRLSTVEEAQNHIKSINEKMAKLQTIRIKLTTELTG